MSPSLKTCFAITAFCLATAAIAQDEAVDPGELELAEILDGRVAGKPVKCLTRMESDSSQVITDTAIVFRHGETIYVNRPRNARFLDEFDLPVFRQFSSDLCRLDQVEMKSRPGLIGGPRVILEDFVPYRKPAKEG